MQKNQNSRIFKTVYRIDTEFDKLMQTNTDASSVVLYEHKSIPRWRTGHGGHLKFWKVTMNEWMMFLLTCDKKLTKSQLNPTHASN